MNVEFGAAALNFNLTSDLCTFLANLEFDDLPPNAVHEARRGVLDYMVRIPMKTATDSYGKRPPVPIQNGHFRRGSDLAS